MFINVANAELRSKQSGSVFRAMFYKLFMHKRARTIITITCLTFFFPVFVHFVKDLFDDSKAAPRSPVEEPPLSEREISKQKVVSVQLSSKFRSTHSNCSTKARDYDTGFKRKKSLQSKAGANTFGSDYTSTGKVILLYSTYRGQRWSVPDGASVFQSIHCPVSNCKLSQDPAAFRAAEAVVFHVSSLSPTTPLPSTKPDYQKWIFLALEPVEQYTHEQRSLLEKIDWTSTYSSDSDIRIPYGRFVSGPPVGKPVSDSSQKTKLVAQLTECNTPKQKRLYVSSLTAHLGGSKLESYGSCGGKPCASSDQCLNDMRNQYKFYLSFETMNCKEFISTEFWENALQYNMVPIVMGGRKKDYERYAPPESFIHAGDFNTSKELAEFLLRLDNNGQKYQQYFDWQALGYAESFLTNGDLSRSTYWCNLCEALHEPDKIRSPRRGTRPIWEWWTLKNQCDNKILWKDLETQIKDMDVSF